MSNGNKHNNGVHEVGKLETLQAYQEDTPGQQVEKYLESIKEVIEEKKEKQKKSFMKVFQNPLKGFPYNEELDDNFVKPLEEGYGKVKDNHYDVKISVKKNDVKNVVKEIEKLTAGNQYEYEDIDMDGVYPYGKTDGDIFIQGDDAGSLGLAIQKSLRNKVKVVGESVEIEEGKYAKYSDLLMKKAKEMQAIDKAQNKSGVASPSLNALKSINKEIEKEMKKLGITESINDDLEEGKMGELFLDIQNGATAKEIARDYPVSIAQAKEFLKDYYSQKKKPMKMGEEILRNYDSLLEAKDLMPDIKKIVDTKSATKVGGIMLDMFTASMILTVYDKVNDQNKGKMEKSNIQTLVHIAHKVMGVKESVSEEVETVLEKAYDSNDVKKVQQLEKKLQGMLKEVEKTMKGSGLSAPAFNNVRSGISKGLESIQKFYKVANKVESVQEGKKIQDIVRKHKRELQKVQRSNNLELSKKAEDELSNWASSNGEIRGDDEDEFIEWLDNNLDDLIKGKIKEDAVVKEGTWALPKTSKQKKELKDLLKKPVILGKEGDDAADKLYDLIGDDGLFDDLYTAGKKNPRGDARPIIRAKMKELGIKEGKMDGQKLTGQEISVYFRRNKVRDKMTKKAVEIALDHGGAMNYAIKQIEKLKRGLSKNKDVEKALNYANFGEQVRIKDVGFMFKEDSPVAGDIQVEGDPYIPQKKGVNKNIAKYWKKEIKGISQKELEAVQSMYMITDHSGVVQMYKAGKRAFIKSLKD